MTQRITRYLALAAQRPALFTHVPEAELILDPAVLEDYAARCNEEIGLIFENPFLSLVVDLIRAPDGTFGRYYRILHPYAYAGSVILPLWQGNIVLLRQFRYGTRQYEIELPRGSAEPAFSPEENAKKELLVEIGGQVRTVVPLGPILRDSAQTPQPAYLFLAHMDGIGAVQREEGIDGYLTLTPEQTISWILDGRIRDSYTIAAVAKARFAGLL